MFIHNSLTQHVSGIIMSIVRRTDCIKPRVVLAWMCWARLCGVSSSPDSTQPHPAHQANTTHDFIQSVLLTMGIMMPEIFWVNLLWINICICVICWFFLLLFSYIVCVYKQTNSVQNLEVSSYVLSLVTKSVCLCMSFGRS